VRKKYQKPIFLLNLPSILYSKKKNRNIVSFSHLKQHQKELFLSFSHTFSFLIYDFYVFGIMLCIARTKMEIKLNVQFFLPNGLRKKKEKYIENI
jgi:hypothetical protein